MEDKLTSSELGTALSKVTDNTDLHKAWHLLSLILTTGRPARPAELASRCTSFRFSHEYIEFLFSIPNSPIFLTENRFASLSSAAFVAFGQFMLNLNRISAFVPRIKIGFLEPKRVWDDVAKTYYRKRKRNGTNFEYFPVVKKRAFLQNVVDEEDEEQNMLSPSSKIQNAYVKKFGRCGICDKMSIMALITHFQMRLPSVSQTVWPRTGDGLILDCEKVHFQVNMTRNITTQPVNSSVMTYTSDKFDKMTVITSSLIKSMASLLSCGLKNSGQESRRETDEFVKGEELGCVSTSECQLGFLNDENFLHVPHERKDKCIEADMPHQEPSLLPSRMKNPVVLGEAKMSKPYSMCGMDLNEQYCPEVDEQIIMSPVETDNTLYACNAMDERGEDERVREGKEEEQMCDSGRCKGDVENLPNDTTYMNTPHEHDINTILRSNEMLPTFDREKTSHVKSQAILSEVLLSVNMKQLEKSFSKWKIIQQEAQNPRLQALSQWETIGNYNISCAHIEQQHCKRDNSLISMKQNYKHKRHTEDRRANSKEIKGKIVSTILENQVEPKLLPNFESFTVEEEEGSGGYGTVYRAQRKYDGVTLAIKCPHGNANRHHIQNEVKMLERIGGKNFVIKYEGSFNYGSADCLVLEHVEHDRPEVLKREIDVFQLQWYGYCLFRALAGLHKLGVVHRDVKPGNFLFSRKLNKGYLIDFNLAMDLNHKYVTSDKSEMRYDMCFNHVPLPHAKSLPPAKSRTFLTTNAWETVNQEAGKGSKSLQLLKSLKRKTNQTKEHADLSSRNIIKSQGADGSGITSAKDATSTRIPSAERMREPLPCQGRKELINLVQEAMQGPNHKVTSIPASKRKRIAAPHERLDRKLVYLTPMPLHSGGIAVAGAGLIKSKGDGKHKKEGPCVGTKGFRAPEVLFRSPYQGPKIDIWSAGVTLLYLITGRSPFVGDPDQNIKDIAKLRGSEDLWEVAKLHNRESSFPAELCDMQSLPSKKMRDWCGLNTRRPDFLEVVPRSFFDLVDKCLTVNPRLRISAEEALRHEFFAPCHEQLRKQRLLSSDSGTSLLLNTQPQTCEGLQS